MGGIDKNGEGSIILHTRYDKALKIKNLVREDDYHWEGDKLAQTLNQDHRLRKMLIEAKAPAIQVEGNHIRTQDGKFPSPKLFQCLDRIAGHFANKLGSGAQLHEKHG